MCFWSAGGKLIIVMRFWAYSICKRRNINPALYLFFSSIIIFHLSKLWKAMFFILCDVIFLQRLQWNEGVRAPCEEDPPGDLKGVGLVGVDPF